MLETKTTFVCKISSWVFMPANEPSAGPPERIGAKGEVVLKKSAKNRSKTRSKNLV